MPAINEMKQQAADRAVEFLRSNMILGLGAGSTALLAVRRIGEMYQSGKLKNILGIPCSLQVEREAQQLGIPLTTLNDHPVIDLTIDGADEVDPRLDVIKGGGGALLREKIVAQASRREIIIVDESKLTSALGTRFPVPIEVVIFGWRSQAAFLESLGAVVTLRLTDNDNPYLTDQGNYILDCNFGPIANPQKLALELQARAGIVEHGLFLNLTTDVIIAGEGGIRHLQRET